MENNKLMEDLKEVSVEEQENTTIDYSQLSKEELLGAIQQLKQGEAKNIGTELKAINEAFSTLFFQEKDSAFETFIEEGGHKDDFDYQLDATTKSFNAIKSELYDRIKTYYSTLEEERTNNLFRKNKLLNDLRILVDSDETEESFHKIREIQNEWKEIGHVPPANSSELIQNYRALLDRFYNNLSLLKELKELDRQRNLESKVKICEKAESLISEESVNEAIEILKELHEEYKNIGPIPQEVHEEVWLRFKKASDELYVKKQQIVDAFKAQLEVNFQEKLGIIEKLKPYTELVTTSITDWKKYTEEILAIQEEWKKIGQVPNNKVRDLSKDFWANCKTFFNNKAEFFKELDARRDENLKLKEAICEKAEELKDSEDFRGTTDAIKKLQEEWKKIGQVPRKDNEVIYQRFRAACDTFFDQKRAAFQQVEEEYKQNLEAKEAICDIIETLSSEESSVVEFKKQLEAWNAIGFVPRNDKKTIQLKFEGVIKTYLSKLSIDPQEKTKLELSVQVGALKDDPNSKALVSSKMQQLRKKVAAYESEISTLNTNIEFFANSKSIDKIKADVQNQIDAIQVKIKELKEQLTILNSF